MTDINPLGIELRKLRNERGESLVQVAQALNVERSHLNKIELGAYKPSEALLQRILDHFSVEGNKAIRLRHIAGFYEPVRMALGTEIRGKENAMEQKAQLQPQVSIDPAKVQVLYTDSVLVTSTAYGLVLDVAQSMPGNNAQHVVARIGMSFDHAKQLLAVIHDNIEKNER